MASQGNIDQEASYSFGAAPITVDYIRFELMGPIKTGKGTIEFRSDNQHRAREILFFDLGGTQRVSFDLCDYRIEVIKEFLLVELIPNDTTRKRATIALTNRVSLEQFLTNMDKSRRQTSMKINRPQYPIKKKPNSVHGSKIQSIHIEATAPTEDDSKTTFSASSSPDTGISPDRAKPLHSVDSISSSDGVVDGSESNRKSSSSDSEENNSESPKRNLFKKSKGGAIKRKETKL
ncbi:hypothetical protein BSL78_01164, partial [Apostichopus japonicus]